MRVCCKSSSCCLCLYRVVGTARGSCAALPRLGARPRCRGRARRRDPAAGGRRAALAPQPQPRRGPRQVALQGGTAGAPRRVGAGLEDAALLLWRSGMAGRRIAPGPTKIDPGSTRIDAGSTPDRRRIGFMSTPHRPEIDRKPPPGRPQLHPLCRRHIEHMSTRTRPRIDPRATSNRSQMDPGSSPCRPQLDPGSTPQVDFKSSPDRRQV